MYKAAALCIYVCHVVWMYVYVYGCMLRCKYVCVCVRAIAHVVQRAQHQLASAGMYLRIVMNITNIQQIFLCNDSHLTWRVW